MTSLSKGSDKKRAAPKVRTRQALNRQTEALVIDAARKWWRDKRPVGWRLVQHVSNPTINTTTASEHRLAAYVGALVLGELLDKREKVERKPKPRSSGKRIKKDKVSR